MPEFRVVYRHPSSQFGYDGGTITGDSLDEAAAQVMAEFDQPSPSYITIPFEGGVVELLPKNTIQSINLVEVAPVDDRQTSPFELTTDQSRGPGEFTE